MVERARWFPRRARVSAGGFTLIEVVIVFAVVGAITTGVALGYLHHKKKAEAAKVMRNLGRIYDASIGYYAADHATLTHKTPPKQFPSSTGETPGVNYCCNQPDKRCDPAKTAALWTENPTWAALGFAPTEPYHHWYKYESEGQGPGARFTVTATGDLDCDGKLSTFVRRGHIDDEGKPVADAPYSNNETE